MVCTVYMNTAHFMPHTEALTEYIYAVHKRPEKRANIVLNMFLLTFHRSQYIFKVSISSSLQFVY